MVRVKSNHTDGNEASDGIPDGDSSQVRKQFSIGGNHPSSYQEAIYGCQEASRQFPHRRRRDLQRG